MITKEDLKRYNEGNFIGFSWTYDRITYTVDAKLTGENWRVSYVFTHADAIGLTIITTDGLKHRLDVSLREQALEAIQLQKDLENTEKRLHELEETIQKAYTDSFQLSWLNVSYADAVNLLGKQVRRLANGPTLSQVTAKEGSFLAAEWLVGYRKIMELMAGKNGYPWWPFDESSSDC